MKNSQAFEHFDGSEIAIIGLAGRFPGAQSADQFWNNLRDGVESITLFTDEQLLSSGVDPEALSKSNYVKARPVLENVEMFDAAFFGYSPREAAIMDPQQRLFLICAWEAIENAGYDPENFNGAISVYAGSSRSSYLINNVYTNPKAMESVGTLQVSISNSEDALTTGIAYKLNLKGACYSIQTFCSTSLVAVHVACQSLLNFECDMAVAGGVSIYVPQTAGYYYEEGTIVSPDGHCRPFSAKAQGTVFGNGLGAVVLRRLEDALENGDNIEAVILGSATNNDGSLKVSYTAPSVMGQAEVIAEAIANAGIQPETITYVETHGTGTELGDPTEVTALTRAFQLGTMAKGFCAIGSVKSNIGHLDRASGAASLIKTVLALKHKQIPPSLHCEVPNPKIGFENSPFFVNTELSEWKTDGIPRRAGVSCFGVGGTNAHVIVQEAPEREPSTASRPYQLLIISAKTSSALEKATQNLVRYFKENPDLKLSDAVYTLQVGRRAFSYRRMIVCQDVNDAVSRLEAKDPKRVLTAYQERRNPPVVFMFSGQGSQYVNMGLELYRNESIFHDEIDRCSEILQPCVSLDLRDVLYPDGGNIDELAQKLKQTLIAQPALFMIEYALAKLWMSWGVHPEAMVGHSIGEYVAACLAGVLSLEDALSLVAARGRLMQQMTGGSMLAVPLSETDVQPFLNGSFSLAAVNAPGLCVVSGKNEAIERLEEELANKEINYTRLRTSHAFHSAMVDPVMNEFGHQVGQVTLHPPQKPILSNVTGTWMTKEQAMDPNYWAGHLRQTVRFSDCVKELFGDPNRVLLEVGPGQTLCTLAKQQRNKSREQFILSSVRHPKEQISDIEFILNTLGKLWMAGIEVDWSGFYSDERRYRVPLPTYAFEHQRYWVEPARQAQRSPASQTDLSETEDRSQRTNQLELEIDHLAPRASGLRSDYVAPRNEVEQAIANIWQKLLGVKQIGIQDDYFDLGGTSLLAAQLFADIEKTFNKKIPLATLINAPTIEQLARIVTDEQWAWSPLMALKADGSNPPFFCIHGADGNIFIYRDLARHLGSDQPVYGLQSQGLDGKTPFHTQIEDMASVYIKEIQTIQPEGPYYFGGYCMGGTIGLEMAQQLHAQGQAVALLALLETYNWANLKKPSLFSKSYHYMQKIDFHCRNLFLAESKWTFLHEKIKVAKNRSNVWFGDLRRKVFDKFYQGNGYNEFLSQLWEANDRAAATYKPEVYPGRITLFRPIKQYALYDNPELGWENLAEGGVDDHILPVYPAGMLVEPFVKQLAEELNACIQRTIENESHDKI